MKISEVLGSERGSRNNSVSMKVRIENCLLKALLLEGKMAYWLSSKAMTTKEPKRQ